MTKNYEDNHYSRKLLHNRIRIKKKKLYMSQCFVRAFITCSVQCIWNKNSGLPKVNIKKNNKINDVHSDYGKIWKKNRHYVDSKLYWYAFKSSTENQVLKYLKTYLSFCSKFKISNRVSVLVENVVFSVQTNRNTNRVTN